MHRSKIEWCRNPDGSLGWVWNPITGCLNGCEYCYARKLANGRLRSRYITNNNLAPIYDDGAVPMHSATLLNSLDPFYPRFWPEKLAELQRGMDDADFQSYIRQKAKGIFVCDMSDLFGIGVPEQWTSEILETIGDDCNSMHRFYLLTKQPQNLIKWSPFPDNCRVGVTATDEAMFNEALWQLSKIKAGIKYISIEPFLKHIPMYVGGITNCGINQIIIGAQTKPYKPPKEIWVREIETAARKAGIAIFEKDNLKPILNRDLIQELPSFNPVG